MLLKDKIVLVTGSTTGIGEAIARRCFKEGAKVMIHGREEDRAKEICQEMGNQSAYHLGNLLDFSVYENLIKSTVNKFGRIDCLINNAALSPRNNIDDINKDDFEWIINLDLRAPLFLTQAAVKEFRKQKTPGTIVNIGSINAYCGETALLVYSMAKGALMTMTRNLGDALSGENIRVNQINVGWTLTENESKMKQSQGFPPDWEKYIPKTFAPRGYLLRPEEVAAHAVFWASHQSAPTTGQVCEVEQYPVIGRNLINTIPLDIFPRE